MEHTLSYFSVLLSRDFSAYTTQVLQQLGLSFGSLPFVLYIGKHPDCTPTELTRALRMDWGHSQRTLTRLTEGGFVDSRKQGRTHRLTLTQAGQDAFLESHQVFKSWDQQHLIPLTPQEQAQLLSLLSRIADASEAFPHV